MQQVAIALHYSSLSTLLWIGISARVIYKEAVWRLPRQTEESPALPPQRPMLRSVNPSHLHSRCTLWVSRFRHALKFWCMAAEETNVTLYNQICSLCPPTKGPLLRFFWKTKEDIAVRDSKKYIGQYEEHGREEMYQSNLTEAE